MSKSNLIIIISLLLIPFGLLSPAATNLTLFEINKTVKSWDPSAIDFYTPIAIAFAVIAVLSLLLLVIRQTKRCAQCNALGVVVWILSVIGFYIWQHFELKRLSEMHTSSEMMVAMNSAVVKNLQLQYGAYLILSGFLLAFVVSLNKARCERKSTS